MSGNIYERIAIYCERHELFHKGDRIIVGLSGGADSVFLLYTLVKLQKRWGLTLHAVHVNHGIRGEEAMHDQKYSVEFAKSLGIGCSVFEADIPSLAKKEKLTEEEAGRIYRYQCFEKLRQELNYSSIAVAHHQEDQAETVLFQMLRGSSLRGLGGIRPKRDKIVRPLLAVGRGEIEQELCQAGIVYCSDSTNEQDVYARNIIRHHVMPYLQEKIQPAAVEHIAQSAADLQEVMKYLDGQVEGVYQKIVHKDEEKITVSYRDFAALHPVLQRELILRMVEELSGRRKDITRLHIEAVCGLYMGETGKSLMLPYTLKAEKSYEDLLLFVDKKSEKEAAGAFQETPITLNAPYFFKGEEGKDWKITFEKWKRENLLNKTFKKNCTKCFDYDRMDTMPIWRYPLEGDYLWLDQTGRKKKLSRLFIDEKIPVGKRKETLVLAEGKHVLWIPALNRCSAYYYITEGTKEVICAHMDESCLR